MTQYVFSFYINFFIFILFFACFFFFFFFQAEDGIRDLTVTGVQTYALPIWGRPGLRGALEQPRPTVEQAHVDSPTVRPLDQRRLISRGEQRWLCRQVLRSEERRVGKECRSRGSPYD